MGYANAKQMCHYYISNERKFNNLCLQNDIKDIFYLENVLIFATRSGAGDHRKACLFFMLSEEWEIRGQ